MKTIYILKHISQTTEVVGTFHDRKKADKAFLLYCDYIQSKYPVTDVEQAQGIEIKQDGYRNFRNGHIVSIEENRLFTDIERFKKFLLD